MGRLQGKVAFITGGGSGIGRATALLFAQEGAKVAVADRVAAAGQETIARIEADGGDAIFLEIDVSKADEVKAALDSAVSEYGGLDTVFNNAGGTRPDDGDVTVVEDEAFWSTLQVNLFGPWLGCKYGIPHLANRGGGSIINTASMNGMVGIPGFDAYSTAKGGIVAMTRAVAVECGPRNIRVNTIAPGLVLTEKAKKRLELGELPGGIPGRHVLGLIEPAQVAYLALFLASDESLAITGQTILVDSGATMAMK